jgi:hypothetical protein
MKTLRALFFILSASVILFSCQKEVSLDSGNDAPPVVNPLLGNWKFVDFQAGTKVTIELTDAGVTLKTISTSNYTTANNRGLYEFTPDKVFAKGIAYDISTTVDVQLYENNVFVESITEPFEFELPPTDLSSPYKLKGDSIIFSDPNFTSNLVEGNAIAYKYTITGNKLKLNGKFLNTYNEDIGGGIIAKFTNDVTAVLNLEKQ